MYEVEEQKVIEFDPQRSLEAEDWDYAFAAARVRVLESMMLTHATLVDMANAESFDSAVELLSGSEYAMSGGVESLDDIEAMLLEKRREVRELFVKLIDNETIMTLLRAREDFANMRLAVRRVVTDRPIGRDYSNDGSISAEEFEEIFEQENYGMFPEYLQEAVEKAVLGYYDSKDIRQIDYGIDRVQAAYKLYEAENIGSEFLSTLFRMQIDLFNIKTMLRLKLADRLDKNLFFEGGYVGNDIAAHGLDLDLDAIIPLYAATPYHDVVDGGVRYLISDNSFLVFERLCEEHKADFLRSSFVVASGPQPVIAYFLLKEMEIRTVRMILSCKKNGLDAKVILDRISLT
ncbi:MAG: V-type ATPase subunit [Planctomycetes bacterium]|nr:V-type ATPase subunit [Planctomycetota bacterium]